MRQFVVLRRDDVSGLITGYFDGVTFTENQDSSMVFATIAEARGQAGILQKNEPESDILVKGATLSLVIEK